MKHNIPKTQTVFAFALLIAASVPLTTQTALACSPEIRLDPAGGIALPQRDIEAALAEIEGSVTVADRSR